MLESVGHRILDRLSRLLLRRPRRVYSLQTRLGLLS
jgi:hypothetical protein